MLEEYLEQVLRYHPTSRRALLLRQNTEAQMRIARGGFDPTLDSDWEQKSFSGSNYFLYGQNTLVIPTPLPIDFKAGYNYTSGIFINPEETIPAGGQGILGFKANLLQGFRIDDRRAALQQAKLVQRANEAEQVAMINQLILDATKAYWDWVNSTNQVRIYQNALDLAEVRMTGIVNSFIQGDKPAIDTLETLIQVQNRQVQLNEAELALTNSQQTLSIFLWSPQEQPVLLAPQVGAPNLVKLDVIIPSGQWLTDLFSRIDLQHPDLRTLQIQLQALDVELRLKSEKLKPKLSVEYNMLANRLDFLNRSSSEDGQVIQDLVLENYKWGVNFSMPLFFRQAKGNVELTQVKTLDTQNKLNQKRAEIITKVQNYFNDIRFVSQQLAIYEDAVQNYERLLAAERIKFQIGESSIFLLNSREDKLIEAQLKLGKLYSTFFKAQAGLQWAAGLTNFGVTNQ